MKEFLFGMGLGFVVGTMIYKTNKPFAETVDKSVEKSKEIIEDIKDEVMPKNKNQGK